MQSAESSHTSLQYPIWNIPTIPVFLCHHTYYDVICRPFSKGMANTLVGHRIQKYKEYSEVVLAIVRGCMIEYVLQGMYLDNSLYVLIRSRVGSNGEKTRGFDRSVLNSFPCPLQLPIFPRVWVADNGGPMFRLN
jgi:hypothetical protein